MHHPSGIELKLMRVRRGVRQYRVAQVLGIPASALCDIENGRKAVGPALAARIAAAIGDLAGQVPPRSDDAPAA